MDPFSGVTALVPIALMLLKAGYELKVFVRALRSAPDDVDHFVDDMISYMAFFKNFHKTIQEPGYNLDSREGTERRELVERVAKQAGFVMKGFKEDFLPIFDSVRGEENLGSTGFVSRLRWYMKKSEVADLKRSLEEAKSSAQLLLSVFNYDLNRRNGLVLQTILRPNQVPHHLTMQRVSPEARPQLRIESSEVHLISRNSGNEPALESAFESNRHDNKNNFETTKRTKQNRILSWLGAQTAIKTDIENDIDTEVETEIEEEEESTRSSKLAIVHRRNERPRERSPRYAASISSSAESSTGEDDTGQRSEGRPSLASRFKDALRNRKSRREPRVMRSPSMSTSSLKSGASLSSSAGEDKIGQICSKA
ncbi:hypothetical protein PG990_006561 [Apiospora arundinis]